MRRPSPTLSITRVCFGSPLPFPPLGTLTATHPSTPALRLPGGCLRSCSQVQCGPGADTGLAPQALALSLAIGACRAGQPPPRPRAGVPGHSGSFSAASPRHPGRSPPVPVLRRSALRRPSAGQPPAERPAKGSPKAGWDWSGTDDRAQRPRCLYFVFALNSLCPASQLPRGGRRGPSPPGFISSSRKGWPASPIRYGAPLSPAERSRRAGPSATAAVVEPMPRAARRQVRSPRASDSPPPSSPAGTAVRPALSAPGTGQHRSSPGQAVQPVLGAPALTPNGGAHRAGAAVPCRRLPSPGGSRRGVPGPRRGLSAGCPSARQAGAPSGHPRRRPPARAHLWGPAVRDWSPAQCHPAAARQRARRSCPAATWTGRRQPLSPSARRIPSALPAASGRRSGRRAGAHPGGAAAVPLAADFVEARRGPRAGRAGAAPRRGWSGHRRHRCRNWRKRCLWCRCQQGTRKAEDSVLLLYLPGDQTSTPSAAAPGAALAGPGVGGNPHPTTAVFLFPFKIRLALSNFDSCFENSVNLRFWVLF